jgi:probable rRNA maturation factor
MSSEGDSRSDGVTLLFRTLPPQIRILPADRPKLKEFAQTLAQTIGGMGGFTCLLTSDRELQRLNNRFLGHDYPTDVLSFPNGGNTAQLGEMAISVARARAQAAEFGHSCLDEIRILMLHGFLHLTGMDHATDRGEMAREERKWRDAFGLPCALISRNKRAREGRKQ